MTKLNKYFLGLILAFGAASCQKADSENPWGEALIYMPQANYTPYVVPNGGTNAQFNKNYNVETGRVNIFLGIYRSGLQEMLSYEVSVSAGTAPLGGTTLLPTSAYELPAKAACPAGKRDAGFYLSVDIEYLKANAATVFSLPVTISSPSRYSLNGDLVTTQVKIETATLIAAEEL